MSAKFVPLDLQSHRHSIQPVLTLRRILLLAFVLLGILPSAALSWLCFTRTREAMTHEIQENLGIQARAIQSDIDQMLFERFENAAVWRRSELMEDLRLGDVDKRVSNYLVGLQQGYGDVYAELDCIDAKSRILASSMSARIGEVAPPESDERLSVSSRLSGEVTQLWLQDAKLLDDHAPLVIDAAIPSAYAASAGAGTRLRMSLNVGPLNRLLDAAAQGRRVIVVVDSQGRWVVGSHQLRGHPLPDPSGRNATRAIAQGQSPDVLAHSPWLAEPALTGRAASASMPGFGGSGWTTLIFEPLDEALAPVSRMAIAFASLFAVVLVGTVAAASWIASAMSRPIVTLTQRTRRYQQGLGGLVDAMPGSVITEVKVLTRTYDEMIRSLEQSRQELIRASKMAVLGELGAVLAHEVRTPLGILRSSAQILMRNPGLGPDGLELMHFIESETERLDRLVSTLLDTARPPQLQPVRCNLHELLTRCVQMHAVKRGDQAAFASPIRLELNATNAWTVSDPEQLQQVFFNLLSNASEAAGPTGQVALSTFDTPAGICIDCEDSGPGVPPELESEIFEPFVSRRTGGFGLGLAVVRQIVAAHEGVIRVGTSRWGGARFSVCLPHVSPSEGALK